MTFIAQFARRRRLAAALAAAAALLSQVAAAQVQAQASPTQRLSEALRSLARDPQYFPSLIEAAQASLALDDVDAALGFFRRAEAVAPADGRVKAGLATAMVRQGQPLEALRLFAEAEQAGEPMRVHAADRGLAYDLIGDNARAQEDYRLALSVASDPVVTRRLALSQAIAGDRSASEATLLPLLQRRELSAYRTRAFALAVLGRADEAVSIAETMLPASLSSRMAPYLRYMPRLTRAQQAAAANLGRFPQAAQIGREDPALAAYAAQGGAPQAARGGADARLVPSGEPLGPSAGDSRIPRREDNARLGPVMATPATPEAPQAVEEAPERVEPAAPVVLAANDPPQPPPEEIGPPAVVVAALPSAPPEPELPRPSVSLAAQAQTPAAVVPPPTAQRDLSQAFAEFSLPPQPAVPAQGAVDITRIEPKREEPRVEPRPAPPPRPVHPSRHWVQVATGRDTGALAFDWRKFKREAGGLLDRTEPHIAAWGQTNRLVAGPFASAREANELVAKLKEKEVDSFRFTSAQGEEVRRLD